MRPILWLLSLLAAGPVLGQSVSGDLTVVPQGSYGRGRTTDFSIMASSAVRGIAYLDLLIPDFGFVAPRGSPLLQAGALLEKRAVSITGATADLAVAPGGPFGPSTDENVYQIDFMGAPVNGPGELFRLSVFHRIDVFGGETMGPVDGSGPIVFVRQALDSDGMPVPLTTASLPVRYDFRRFGDLNHDRRLDLADVTILLRAAAGLVALDDAMSWYADLSPTSADGRPMQNGRYLGDGRIDLSDVITGLRVITGLWDSWWPDRL